jgi:hypothetical protein
MTVMMSESVNVVLASRKSRNASFWSPVSVDCNKPVLQRSDQRVFVSAVFRRQNFSQVNASDVDALRELCDLLAADAARFAREIGCGQRGNVPRTSVSASL